MCVFYGHANMQGQQAKLKQTQANASFSDPLGATRYAHSVPLV